MVWINLRLHRHAIIENKLHSRGKPLISLIPSSRDRLFVLCVTVILLVFITVPYFVAELSAGESLVFGGFLLNPIDGMSYLAKIYQGWRGDWLFTLPYTAEKGQGAWVFQLYILLGHLARSLGISLLYIYHGARILFAAIMSLAIFRFCQTYLSIGKSSRLAFLLAIFGSGLGWLVLPFDAFTSDFWVAEAYPFLSAYTNPHFALSLTFLLFLLSPVKVPAANQSMRKSLVFSVLRISLPSFALAMMSPFAVVIALSIWAGMLFWDFLQATLEHSKVELRGYIYRLVWIGIGGAPILVYQYIVMNSDPLFSEWMIQNITPSPPIWDAMISLSPLLLLVPYGAWVIILNRNKEQRLLLVWVVVSLILLYTPFSLQRRFMMGIYVPVAILAAMSIDWMIKDGRRFWFRSMLLLLIVLPTNLLILRAAWHGIQTRDDRLYLSKDEIDALAWVEENSPSDALILAAPETGLFIPAITGRRVIYGHPFETVHAEKQEERVLNFYQGVALPNPKAWLGLVDYVYYGPREREIGKNELLDALKAVFQNQSVVIYATK